MEPLRIYVNKKSSAVLAGFTLIEMIVVLAIIGIITTVVLNSQQTFNKSLVITDTAYTVALSLRQAQVFGLSSRTFAGQASANYGYGAHFDYAKPTSYLIFADLNQSVKGGPQAYCPVGTVGQPDYKPGNCRFDNSLETLQNYTFGRGFKISTICGHVVGGGTSCTSDGVTPLTLIDIVFLRPNTDSVITAERAAASAVQLSDATITITDPNNLSTRVICVSLAGQVSVATSTCP